MGCFCIGTNQVDLVDAAERGVAVFNAPYSNTRSVVELVIGEIIALARRLPEKTQRMHEGVWDKSARGSHEVRGRTLGIVGYGNIGTQLSNIAEAIGLRVVFYDTADRLAHGNARRMHSLDELLAVRRGEPARRRAARQRRPVRCRPVRPDEAARRCSSTPPAAWWSTTTRCGEPVRADRRRGARRVPGRAQGAGRRVRVGAARPRQRHPHPARRRLHPGGAGGDRALRGRQAARVRHRRRHGAVGQPARWPRRTRRGVRIGYLQSTSPVCWPASTPSAEAGVNVVGQALSTSGERGYVVTDTDTGCPKRRWPSCAAPRTPSGCAPGRPDVLTPGRPPRGPAPCERPFDV